jgi:predicted NBD/HSP70 family sugar kinase
MQKRLPDGASGDKALILSLIRRNGGCSRLELSALTGLRKSVLGARLRELLVQGLVVEESQGLSTGGRPPAMIRLARRTACVVSVDIAHNHVQVSLANLNAEPAIVLRDSVGVLADRDGVLRRSHDLIEDALSRADVAHDRIRAIGISVEGPVEANTGRLRSVSPLLAPLAVRDYFEAAYNWPVLVENDVNVLALAEAWAGGARDVEDFLYVKLGSGVGCSIVYGGQIYRGADGLAGELGHIRVFGQDGICACGSTGCLGTVASGRALAQKAEELARNGSSPYLARLLEERGELLAEDLGAALREQDLAAAAAIKHAGGCVGQVLGALVSFNNPSLIVIGGGVTKLGDLLLSAIREAVYQWSLPLSARHLVIQSTRLGDEAPLVGAAAMAVSRVYGLTPYVTAR